jgi:hypothetical protein
LYASHLFDVSKFIACCVTMHCCVPLGIGTYGAGATGDATIPGVFLHVTWQLMPGVSFNFLFAVGLRASMMPGASVIFGVVMVG